MDVWCESRSSCDLHICRHASRLASVLIPKASLKVSQIITEERHKMFIRMLVLLLRILFFSQEFVFAYNLQPRSKLPKIIIFNYDMILCRRCDFVLKVFSAYQKEIMICRRSVLNILVALPSDSSFYAYINLLSFFNG